MAVLPVGNKEHLNHGSLDSTQFTNIFCFKTSLNNICTQGINTEQLACCSTSTTASEGKAQNDLHFTSALVWFANLAWQLWPSANALELLKKRGDEIDI